MARSIDAQRVQIRRVVRQAKLVGYSALTMAIVAVALGAFTRFTRTIGLIMAIGLVISILVLPLPIVLAYGLRAAEREDRRLNQSPTTPEH